MAPHRGGVTEMEVAFGLGIPVLFVSNFIGLVKQCDLFPVTPLAGCLRTFWNVVIFLGRKAQVQHFVSSDNFVSRDQA